MFQHAVVLYMAETPFEDPAPDFSERARRVRVVYEENFSKFSEYDQVHLLEWIKRLEDMT